MIRQLTHMEWLAPWWLIGLAAVLVAAAVHYLYSRKRYGRMSISSMSAYESSSGIRSWLLDPMMLAHRLMPIFQIIGLTLLILAMARPRSLLREENIKAEGIDIFLAMDLSSSMLSQDFEPDRLTVAKKVASEFVADRPYDRFGLAVFAGESYTQSPLTSDHSLLRGILASLECGQLADGTAIGMGLASAVNRLKDSEAKSRIIILLTDGSNNEGQIQPMQAAEIARQLGITVYTIGVGSRGVATVPVGRRADGTYVYKRARVVIDEELLQRISKLTGGKYYRATDEAGLKDVYVEIDELEKTELEITTIKRYAEEYPRLVLLGLGLFLGAFALQRTILRTYPDHV